VASATSLICVDEPLTPALTAADELVMAAERDMAAHWRI